MAKTLSTMLDLVLKRQISALLTSSLARQFHWATLLTEKPCSSCSSVVTALS
jgi:hypothetical protein